MTAGFKVVQDVSGYSMQGTLAVDISLQLTYREALLINNALGQVAEGDDAHQRSLSMTGK